MKSKAKKQAELSSIEKAIRARFAEGFDLIQVIMGPRQVGKTTAILSYLKEYKGEYLYVSAEEKIALSSDWLSEVWQQAIDKSRNCLLVIDEIQKIPQWSERIKMLWDKQSQTKQTKIQLILLGSSSVKIQTGLSESLTGRFELIRAFHWSLAESRIIKKMNLEEYLIYGGYPGSYKLISNKKRFGTFIENSIVNTVIEKDLLTLARIRNPALFKQTFHLLQNLPATEISYTKLLGQLQEKGNTDLIKNYLDLYEGAFLFSQIHKYHKKIFRTRLSTPKMVCMAPSLLNLNQKKSSEFLGLCFESLVGADLIRAGLSVTYWRDGDYEIDFVVELSGQLFGIEVKSQKRKSSKSVSEFIKEFPKAKIIYINFDNYEKFSAGPEKYILSLA